MRILKSADAVRDWTRGVSGSTGFVPTMGALHEGHSALIERAVNECDSVIVSIFVNPTQFNDSKDFESYPISLEADFDMASRAGASAAYVPESVEIYKDGQLFEIRESLISQEMEGRARPGHFWGVLTVVMKLLNIVKPTRAYFGEKDYQQFLLIRRMAAAFFLDCEIIPCPTVRAADGLALSSRNQRLTIAARQRAPKLFHTLKNSDSIHAARSSLEDGGFLVEYIEEHWGRRFVAAQLEDVRLIDNVKI
ncbi:MAG: pantoate--beta-alanine ligase [Verrucomicrobiota bacterium]